jgi:hypothetical protein
MLQDVITITASTMLVSLGTTLEKKVKLSWKKLESLIKGYNRKLKDVLLSELKQSACKLCNRLAK